MPPAARPTCWRAIGQRLNEAWGQPVISDNRAGADGLIATCPPLVMVHPKVPARTLKELLALAGNANPPLTYASGGNGSSQHFAGALFARLAGLTLTHVACKGGNPALQDLMAGNVDMMIIQPNSPSQITSGQVRALAVSSRTRSAYYPDLPTVEEAGVAQGQAARHPRESQRGGDQGLLLRSGEGRRRRPGRRDCGQDAAGFRHFIQAERKRYAPIVREAGMMVE